MAGGAVAWLISRGVLEERRESDVGRRSRGGSKSAVRAFAIGVADPQGALTVDERELHLLGGVGGLCAAIWGLGKEHVVERVGVARAADQPRRRFARLVVDLVKAKVDGDMAADAELVVACVTGVAGKTRNQRFGQCPRK